MITGIGIPTAHRRMPRIYPALRALLRFAGRRDDRTGRRRDVAFLVWPAATALAARLPATSVSAATASADPAATLTAFDDAALAMRLPALAVILLAVSAIVPSLPRFLGMFASQP